MKNGWSLGKREVLVGSFLIIEEVIIIYNYLIRKLKEFYFNKGSQD